MGWALIRGGQFLLGCGKALAVTSDSAYRHVDMGYVVAVDETKAKGYVMVAAAVPAEYAGRVRRDLSNLVMPGQRSLHMRSEGNRRRKRILQAMHQISVSGLVRVSVYEGGGRGGEYDQRRLCLRSIVADHVRDRDVALVIDRDFGQEAWDRQTLIEERRALALGSMFRYEHRARSDDHLLAIPDAIAWCWNRGGEWKRNAASLVDRVREVGL